MAREWRAPAGPLGGPRPATATAASAGSHNSKSSHHKPKRGSSKGGSSSEFVKVGPLKCPKSSIITTATGSTFKGPNSQNGGTAACIYQDQAGDELNVIYELARRIQEQVGRDRSVKHRPAGSGRVGAGRGSLRHDDPTGTPRLISTSRPQRKSP